MAWKCGAVGCPGHRSPNDRCSGRQFYCGCRRPMCPGHRNIDHKCMGGSIWHCGAKKCATHSHARDSCPAGNGPWWCGRTNPACPGHRHPTHRCAGGAAPLPYYLKSDQGIASALIAVFDSAHLWRINFRFESVSVVRTDWQRVARALERCHILAKRHRNTALGVYNHINNTFSMPPPRPDPAWAGLAVHEGVHAMNDLKRGRAWGMDNEGAAYVAQVAYWRIRGYQDLSIAGITPLQAPQRLIDAKRICNQGLGGSVNCMVEILRAALVAADLVLTGQPLTHAVISDVQSAVTIIYHLSKMLNEIQFDG